MSTQSEPADQADSAEQVSQARRDFLSRGGAVLAWAGLANLLGKDAVAAGGQAAAASATARTPHFAPKAKRAIYLFMAGAPSQFETWDYKPKLTEMFDKDLPDSV